MREKQPIVLDVYEVLDQLGIDRDAVRFLIERPAELDEKTILERVPPVSNR